MSNEDPAYAGWYKGWRVWLDHLRPVSGQWRAVRHGVGLCHTTEAGLLRMIDARNEEARVSRAGRQ